MRTQQVLDELLELLQAEEEGLHFKTYGAYKKHLFQTNKSEDEIFLRSDMYKGQIGNPEAARKGHKNRKNKEEINKRAAETRANWYKNPENMEKFMAKLRKRAFKVKDQKK